MKRRRRHEFSLTHDEIREMARIVVALEAPFLLDDERRALNLRLFELQAIPKLGRADIAAAFRRAQRAA